MTPDGTAEELIARFDPTLAPFLRETIERVATVPECRVVAVRDIPRRNTEAATILLSVDAITPSLHRAIVDMPIMRCIVTGDGRVASRLIESMVHTLRGRTDLALALGLGHGAPEDQVDHLAMDRAALAALDEDVRRRTTGETRKTSDGTSVPSAATNHPPSPEALARIARMVADFAHGRVNDLDLRHRQPHVEDAGEADWLEPGQRAEDGRLPHPRLIVRSVIQDARSHPIAWLNDDLLTIDMGLPDTTVIALKGRTVGRLIDAPWGLADRRIASAVQLATADDDGTLRKRILLTLERDDVLISDALRHGVAGAPSLTAS